MDLDYSDSVALARKLDGLADQLAGMTMRVAQARQVREFDSDRRKSALSRAVQIVMAGRSDLSISAAEHAARALESYGKDMAKLAQELTAAEGAITEWEVVKIQWETCRSIISLQKSAMATL